MSSFQRSRGTVRIAVEHRRAATRVARLFQQGSAKARFPKAEPGHSGATAILINTSGGMTGGDRYAWEIEAGADTALTVTTQASEKMYKAGQGTAEIGVRLLQRANSYLAWLPQETILFDSSHVSRTIEVDMEEGASLLLCEAVVFGRLGRGETVRNGFFRDRWRVRSQGRLVHAEETLLDGGIAGQLAVPAIADGMAAAATIIAIGPNIDRFVGRVRSSLEASPGLAGGVSAWTVGKSDRSTPPSGKLLARLVATDGYALRNALLPLLRMLNGQAEMPKV